jgi:Ca2+-transporting ATPase
MRSNRSLSEIGVFTNKKLVMSFVICAFLQIVVISIVPLARIFQVVPLNLRQWAIVFLLSITPIVIVELQKKINKKSHT